MELLARPVFETGASSGLRIAVLVAVYIVFALWLKHAIARVPLGTPRFLLSLPILAVNIVCPWFFSKAEVLQCFCTLFICTWLCTFKVLAFCWGRAPLRESMTVSQVAAVLMLPLFPKPLQRAKAGPEGRLQDSAGSGAALACRWFGKTVLLGLMVHVVHGYGSHMPRVVRHYLTAFVMYSLSGILMDGPAVVTVELLGLPVVPTFDQPWMSASLAEFWGRRWNIPTTSVLRTVVYDTVVDGSLINPERLQQPAKQRLRAGGPPSLLRRQLGLHAAFLVSGLVHEYMAWVLIGTGVWGWKWTLFFWLQAPLMSMEAYGSSLLRRAGLRLPHWLCVLLTVVLLEVLAYDTFFNFMEDTGISPSIIAALDSCYRALLAPLRPYAEEWLAVAWRQ